MTRLMMVSFLVLASSGCTYVTFVQLDDAGPPPDAAAEIEPGCLRWEASPGTDHHEGSPEDVRCVEWSEGPDDAGPGYWGRYVIELPGDLVPAPPDAGLDAGEPDAGPPPPTCHDPGHECEDGHRCAGVPVPRCLEICTVSEGCDVGTCVAVSYLEEKQGLCVM